MTGGTSLLTNMVDLAEQIFDLPVRIGYPRKVGGMGELVAGPQFATGIGLIYYGMKNESQRRLRQGEAGFFSRVATDAAMVRREPLRLAEGLGIFIKISRRQARFTVYL